MSVERELLTKEQYIAKLARRSKVTARTHQTAINSFDRYLEKNPSHDIKKKLFEVESIDKEY